MAGAGRILLVEDEPLLRLLMADEFADHGYEVKDVESGDAAVAILRSGERFDLLFTDIRLQGDANGWDLAEEARQLIPELPVVYTTGYSEFERERVPGSRLLLKPCRPSDAIEAFRALGVHPLGAGEPGLDPTN